METENSKDNTEIKAVRRLSNLFAQQDGRRPRIMIAEPKSDLINSDSKLIASFYADLGFDVDIPPPFEHGIDIVKQAIESDVHILCISINNSHVWAPAIIEEFNNYKNKDFKIVLNADMTAQDCSFFLKKGVTAIFPRNATPITVGKEILKVLLEN